MFRWAFQVVEQSVAAEPASSVEFGFIGFVFEVDPDTGRIVTRNKGVPRPVSDKDGSEWWIQEVELKGTNGRWYSGAKRICGDLGGQTNCHGTTVAGGQGWINDADFADILRDFFVPTNTPKEGNLVVWRNETGQPVHSAILTSIGRDLESSKATGLSATETGTSETIVWYLNGTYSDENPKMYELKPK